MQPFVADEMETFKSAHRPVAVSNTQAVVKRLLLRGVGIAFYTRLGFSEEQPLTPRGNSLPFRWKASDCPNCVSA